jgi:hypothetical protein
MLLFSPALYNIPRSLNIFARELFLLWVNPGAYQVAEKPFSTF